MTAKSGNILLLATIPLLMILVYMIETLVPEVVYYQISSPQLERFFEDRLVVHLTDQHLVNFGWREEMTLSRVEEINPDLIIMTGDYLEAETDIRDFERYINRLTAIATVIATPGNNDYCCMDTLVRVFSEAGVVFLKNQAVLLERPGDSLYLVGLEDNFLWKDDYFRAVAPVPAGVGRIVLGHAPGIAEKIDPEGVELIMSGHLHGGQISLPLLGSSLSSNRICFCSTFYTGGLYEVNGITLLSNRGLGTSIIPIRFFARPEIAVLGFEN